MGFLIHFRDHIYHHSKVVVVKMLKLSLWAQNWATLVRKIDPKSVRLWNYISPLLKSQCKINRSTRFYPFIQLSIRCWQGFRICSLLGIYSLFDFCATFWCCQFWVFESPQKKRRKTFFLSKANLYCLYVLRRYD